MMQNLFLIGGLIAFSLLGILCLVERRRGQRDRKDLAALRLAEEKLRQSEEEFRAAMYYATIGKGLVSPEGIFLKVNPALCKFLGRTESELVGSNFASITHPEDLAASLTQVRQLLNREIDTFNLEKRYVLKDGRAVWGLVSASLVWDSDGKPKHFITQIQDITDRKRAEQELLALNLRLEEKVREQSFELERFFSLSAELLCIAGFDGWFKRLNATWERTLGWTREELLSKPFLEFVHPEDRLATQAAAGRLEDGEQVIGFENRYLCRDGSYRWLLWQTAPFSERNLIFATAHDFTDQKRDADILAKTNRRLEAVNQELESFSYSVSHDLRAPLRQIGGFVELLTRETKQSLSPAAADYLDKINQAANSMGQLIDDLLGFSRASRVELRECSVDLVGLAREIVRSLQLTAPHREIQWLINPLPPVLGDPALLKQVLFNLLDNARKYTQPRSPAVIELGCAGQHADEAVFFVRDNGVGFDMKLAGKLFRVFQRLHSSEEFEGTGIGLATVRRIVQRHGGRVWPETSPGKGATFYFSLRTVAAPLPQAEVPQTCSQ